RALSLTCTHQGCTVGCSDTNDTSAGWVCPCHGAVYEADGQVVGGPAKRALPQYKILKRDGDRAQLIALNGDTNDSQLTRLEADYFVFAADVRGVKHLFDLGEGEMAPDVGDRIAKLPIADPFAVARFWFDRDFPWSQSEFTSLSGYRLTDSITRYHKIQDDYIAWHEKTGGSVVELHAYCYKEKEFPTQTALLETFKEELYDLVPELQDAQILHQQLVNQKNFSGYPPNSYRDRPSSRSGAPNLFFAGDWVKMPFPCGLMERAVSSGLLAANEICHDEGLQRRTLYTVRPQGILPV
ncbi:MAG: FAD-dependent oxidoreductase, partial [Cyanobacteria bacterium P01_H01_bin.130]